MATNRQGIFRTGRTVFLEIDEQMKHRATSFIITLTPRTLSND